MELRFVTDQKEWDASLALREEPGVFLQSFAWGEIAAQEGKKVERVMVADNGKVVLQAQLFFYTLPLGMKYGFCPGGPVGEWNAGAIKLVCEYVAKQGAIFLRVEPATKPIINGLEAKKTIDQTPRATTVLDLHDSFGALLVKMHPKTRYNISLAERKGVVVKEQKDFDLFWKLSAATAARDMFSLHSRKHYELIFKSGVSRQFTAWQESTPLATAVTVGFGKTLTYLFGASEYEHRALMGPHLLQWEMIRAAREAGYAQYDFFGIAPVKEEGQYDPKHQYAGVTRFKLGFGGKVVEKPGTFDLIIMPGKYRIYKAIRALRRLV